VSGCHGAWFGCPCSGPATPAERQVGWAFQLQDPRIIFVLLAAGDAIGLQSCRLCSSCPMSISVNKADPRKTAPPRILLDRRRSPPLSATPCTGPFMPCLAPQLILPRRLPLLVIFAGLWPSAWLCPSCLLAFVPAIRNRLPNPGPWLDSFSQGRGGADVSHQHRPESVAARPPRFGTDAPIPGR